MSETELSIITATYNRIDVLKMTLEHIARQDFPMNLFEVIIVDDGSEDDTAKVIRDLIHRLPYRVCFFQQDHAGPGAAHNKGVTEARSNIIVFLADDMLPAPSLLKSYFEMHQKHPENHIAVVGQLRESPDLPQTVFQKAWNPFLGRELDGKTELSELDFFVSNVSMKRDFFLKHGGFLEVPEPAWEDVEMAYRFHQNGLKLIYCSEALAYHYHIQNIDTVIARTSVAGKNFVLFEELVGSNRLHEYAHIRSSRLKPSTYLNTLLRDLVRLTFFNGLTVPHILVPAIRKAEFNRYLAPCVGFMTRRVTTYYFKKWIRKGRRERRNHQ